MKATGKNGKLKAKSEAKNAMASTPLLRRFHDSFTIFSECFWPAGILEQFFHTDIKDTCQAEQELQRGCSFTLF